ncbi:hypothetical protein ABFS83_04G179100 [Erythranthe nasuta]
MAYAALISLKQTIKPLLNSCHVSIVQSTSRQIIQPLYDDVCSLQEVLKELDSSSRSSINRKRVNALDGEIREAVCEFEDVLESHFSNQLRKAIGEEETHHPLIDLQELKQNIDSFTQNVNTMKATYVHELRYPLPLEEDEEEEEDGDDDSLQSRICSGGNDESKMVGLSDCYTELKEKLTQEVGHTEVSLLSLVGMAGIGKTTFAKKLFHDPSVSGHYHKRAFVTLGPQYQLKRVLRDILKQLNHYRYLDFADSDSDADVDVDVDVDVDADEEEIDRLRRLISKSLMGLKYLIVLDDVWEVNVRDVFKSPLLSCPGPRVYGRRVMVTTRLVLVGRTLSFSGCYRIPFLNKKESWDLLRAKVFGEQELFSYEVEQAGKKIAENCEGLPLTIVTVGELLFESDKTTEYWNEVAANKQHSVYVDAYDRMFEVLYPSYDYLDQHLKPCFLYVAVFPQNYEFPCSQLVNLWVAEGFAEPDGHKTATFFAYQFLIMLMLSSVALQMKSSIDHRPKTSGLISPFWHLCNKEAAKNKFFRGLNKRADGLAEEAIHGQRRLSVRNNVLFGIKDVFDSMGSVSTVRSLLCTGPYHQYPVPVCLGSRLLMILDALTIHFYEFPNETLNLVQLTYLALTFNGKIPASISKLWNLHYLIVNRHQPSIVKPDGNSFSYLPMEIWDMKELENLEVMGRNLPHPSKCERYLLPNLMTLLGVGPQSCTKDVLERIPNLQNLEVRIELAPDNNNDEEPLCFFDDIYHLHKLEKLKCVIVNPKLVTSEVIVAPSFFPRSLVMLTLTGLGYAWEEMRKISPLPNLKVLKLRRYAFRGPKWEVGDGEFKSLEYLQIEDTDLVSWTTGHCLCFQTLRQLSMKHCYKLEEIPTFRDGLVTKIELVDCNPKAVDCANKITSQILNVKFSYSWD